MYFAQLDENGKCITCYVAEEIVIEKDIMFHSDTEVTIDAFCEGWNKAIAEKNNLQKAFALSCRILDSIDICPAEVMGTEWERCKGMPRCGDSKLWECWQKLIFEILESEQVCRICGCTQNNACEEVCYWAGPDLCSTCAGTETEYQTEEEIAGIGEEDEETNPYGEA